MKLIVTQSNSDGTFDEVGMNHRRLFNGTSKPHMVRKAKSCFPDQDLRLEWFTDSGIYGEPFKTEYVFRSRSPKAGESHVQVQA